MMSMRYDEFLEREVKELIEIEKDQDLDSINDSILKIGKIDRNDIKKYSVNLQENLDIEQEIFNSNQRKTNIN